MGWTVVSEIWLFFCLLVAVVYPVIDGRNVLKRAGTLAWGAVTGRKGKVESESTSTSAPVSILEVSKEVKVVSEDKS